MNRSELLLLLHRKEFEIRYARERGAAFQTFFEDIMEMADPSFQRVAPHGNLGDWKCDGFSTDTGTCYQVYAPCGVNVYKYKKKIEDDFSGAREKWGSQMRAWIFVWNSEDGLSPPVVQLIEQIKQENEDICVDDWGKEKLWKIAKELPERDRINLFGAWPEDNEAQETTAVEIQTLLKYLVRPDISVQRGDISGLELRQKFERNKLGEQACAIIANALPVAVIVDQYVKKHPDPDFSAEIASSLHGKYVELAASDEANPDCMLLDLIWYVCHGDHASKFFWAAVGIVAYYFQLCDIFER